MLSPPGVSTRSDLFVLPWFLLLRLRSGRLRGGDVFRFDVPPPGIIPLDGQEVLADVARVGMVLLYFRAPDGRTGRAVHEREGWRWVAYDASTPSGREQDLQVRALFDALAKQIKGGFFHLPNALVAEVSP